MSSELTNSRVIDQCVQNIHFQWPVKFQLCNTASNMFNEMEILTSINIECKN